MFETYYHSLGNQDDAGDIFLFISWPPRRTRRMSMTKFVGRSETLSGIFSPLNMTSAVSQETTMGRCGDHVTYHPKQGAVVLNSIFTE